MSKKKDSKIREFFRIYGWAILLCIITILFLAYFSLSNYSHNIQYKIYKNVCHNETVLNESLLKTRSELCDVAYGYSKDREDYYWVCDDFREFNFSIKECQEIYEERRNDSFKCLKAEIDLRTNKIEKEVCKKVEFEDIEYLEECDKSCNLYIRDCDRNNKSDCIIISKRLIKISKEGLTKEWLYDNCIPYFFGFDEEIISWECGGYIVEVIK